MFFSDGKLSEAPIEDPLNMGKKLLLKHREHYIKNRFKCPNSQCKVFNTGQCKSCGAVPYHLGFTCEEYQVLVRCRYCGDGLEHKVDV